MSKPSGYQCLFCGQEITTSPLDPCALHLVARYDRAREEQKEQTFYCHMACLRSRATVHQNNFYIADPDFPTVGELDGDHLKARQPE